VKVSNPNTFKLIVVGHLIVNIPVVLILVLFISIGLITHITFLFILMIAGGFLVWRLWEHLLKRWINWALTKGYTKRQIFKYGRLGLINFYEHKIYNSIDNDEKGRIKNEIE